MEIRPFRGTDEPELLDVWRASMFADALSEHLFRTKVLLDPNFLPDNLPVAIEDGRVVGFVLVLTRQVPLFLQGLEPEKAWITAPSATRTPGPKTTLGSTTTSRPSQAS